MNESGPYFTHAAAGPDLFTGKEALIFDFDGTIADTFSLHEKAFQQALESEGLTFNYGDYTGMSTRKAIQLIFEANGRTAEEEQLQQLTAAKRKLANELYRTYIRFLPGALDFIRAAHQFGYRMFIGSSGSRMNILTGMEALELGSYFSDVITADDVTHAKPDPEIFQTLLNRHNLSPSACLVIEDAISGIRAAVAARIDVVCVDPFTELGSGYPVLVCKSGFGELLNFLTDEQPNRG